MTDNSDLRVNITSLQDNSITDPLERLKVFTETISEIRNSDLVKEEIRDAYAMFQELDKEAYDTKYELDSILASPRHRGSEEHRRLMTKFSEQRDEVLKLNDQVGVLLGRCVVYLDTFYRDYLSEVGKQLDKLPSSEDTLETLKAVREELKRDIGDIMPNERSTREMWKELDERRSNTLKNVNDQISKVERALFEANRGRTSIQESPEERAENEKINTAIGEYRSFFESIKREAAACGDSVDRLFDLRSALVAHAGLMELEILYPNQESNQLAKLADERSAIFAEFTQRMDEQVKMNSTLPGLLEDYRQLLEKLDITKPSKLKIDRDTLKKKIQGQGVNVDDAMRSKKFAQQIKDLQEQTTQLLAPGKKATGGRRR